MNKHFVCQIKDARLMSKNKQYMKQLNYINNQHNFIVLRALYGDDYETEMHRSMLLEKLQHIHENICFESGIRPPIPTNESVLLTLQTKKYNHVKTVAVSFL